MGKDLSSWTRCLQTEETPDVPRTRLDTLTKPIGQSQQNTLIAKARPSRLSTIANMNF